MKTSNKNQKQQVCFPKDKEIFSNESQNNRSAVQAGQMFLRASCQAMTPHSGGFSIPYICMHTDVLHTLTECTGERGDAHCIPSCMHCFPNPL